MLLVLIVSGLRRWQLVLLLMELLGELALGWGVDARQRRGIVVWLVLER